MQFVRQTSFDSVMRGAARALLCAAVGLLLATASPTTLGAQAREAESAQQKCSSTASLEGRLVIEKWTRGTDCEGTADTRTTDRFLGISCLERSPGISACRAFVPPPGSRAFDTAQVFRCVDIALADTEMGTIISRMREWAAPSKACDWAQAPKLLTMEVDFARGEVCVGGSCIDVDRLSTIGKMRLRNLIESALRELGIAAWTASSRSNLTAKLCREIGWDQPAVLYCIRSSIEESSGPGRICPTSTPRQLVSCGPGPRSRAAG